MSHPFYRKARNTSGVPSRMSDQAFDRISQTVGGFNLSSPETKQMLQEAIQLAMRLKDRPDLPPNVRKEIMDLLDLSAHPALSKGKVNVQGRIAYLIKQAHSVWSLSSESGLPMPARMIEEHVSIDDLKAEQSNPYRPEIGSHVVLFMGGQEITARVANKINDLLTIEAEDQIIEGVPESWVKEAQTTREIPKSHAAIVTIKTKDGNEYTYGSRWARMPPQAIVENFLDKWQGYKQWDIASVTVAGEDVTTEATSNKT